MKAIVVREFGGPDVMQVEEVDVPVAGAGEVLVRVHAAGVNPVDTYLRSGIHAHAPKLPYTPGKDAAGVVESVGEGVSRWSEGDRVYTADSLTGTYAEYTLCREDQLGELPANAGFDEGAGVWTPYATSFRGLFQKAALRNGEKVLIHGASGGVGVAAVQWAKDAGAIVIGTASSEKGAEIVKASGADAVFDHTDAEHYAQIREFTGNSGVDVIIEMLANENLERDFECIAMFGRIVIIGNRGSLNFTPRLAMTNETTIYGMSLFNSTTEDREVIHAAIYDGLASGYLRPEIGRKFALSNAAAAHTAVIEEKAAGKIVISIG